MKKILLVLVLIFVVPTLKSCVDPTENFEDEKTTQTINHDELGGSDTEGDGDIDLENAG